jgi:hypothetical protein
MKRRNYIIWNGVLMFVGISGLFIIMQAMSLEKETELRLLNVVIVAFFSNRMAKHFAQKIEEGNFLNNMFSIFAANVIAIVLSIISFVIYVLAIEPTFTENFKGWILMAGNDLSLTEAAGGIFLEGVAGAAVISFVVMQYWADVKPKVKALGTTKKLKKV